MAIVYLVGAGPGDPGLMTVRARELVDTCDVVVYDALVNPEMLSGRTPDTLVFVGKRGGDSGSARQDDINATLIRLAREGKSVVRLKGGDPFVFGRGSEEAQALAAVGIPFEIVPGVTAGVAAPAYAGIPVTHRGLATSITFVTGHEDPSKPDTQTDWAALARVGGTIVLYMGVGKLPSIVSALVAGGLSGETPAAAVQWGTYQKQRTVVATVATLADRIAEEGLSAPVITVIGPAVALRDEIRWFDRPETHPLLGRRIVVTRATAQAGTITRRLQALGAMTIEMPSVRIVPIETADIPFGKGGAPLGKGEVSGGAGRAGPRNVRQTAAPVSAPRPHQYVIFSSQNAVALFWEKLRQKGLDARALHGMTIAVVGPATAEALMSHGIAVDIVPKRFVAEGLIEALKDGPSLANARVLYPCAADARDVLPNGLRELGATVDVLPLYRSIPETRGADALRDAIREHAVDLVTFASGSSVRGYVEAVGADLARRVPAVSIGPITSEAARQAGIEVIAEAHKSTIDGLIDAVVSVSAATHLRI